MTPGTSISQSRSGWPTSRSRKAWVPAHSSFYTGVLPRLPDEDPCVIKLAQATTEPVTLKRQRALENLKVAQERQREQYNKKHHGRGTIVPGDHVLMKKMFRRPGKTQKFQEKFIGPFRVLH